MLYETAPIFRRAFNDLTTDQQWTVREDLTATVAEYDDGGVIRLRALARVASGVRPET